MSGSITTGFTSVANDPVYYGGSPYDVWLPYDSGMSAYFPGTGSVRFTLPAASSWLPAGEVLTGLSFTGTGGDDGNGWSEQADMYGTGMTGVSVVGKSASWTSTGLRHQQIDAMGITVGLTWYYGGVPNTFGRMGHASFAAGGGWFGSWTLSYTSKRRSAIAMIV